jgi:hypothetical protein
VESALRDIRFAARSLAKNPGFTTIAVVTLALGIGASTVTFTLVNGVLIRPLPFPESERLMLLKERTEDGSELTLSFPNFDDWRNESRSMEGIAAVQFAYKATVLGADEPMRGTFSAYPANSSTCWVFSHGQGVPSHTTKTAKAVNGLRYSAMSSGSVTSDPAQISKDSPSPCPATRFRSSA